MVVVADPAVQLTRIHNGAKTTITLAMLLELIHEVTVSFPSNSKTASQLA